MKTDLFQGRWVFDVERSALLSPPPGKWVQSIRLDARWLRVREEITHQGGTALVEVEAFPGIGFFPVNGSPIADEMSYQVDGSRITGVARKAGQVTFRETMDFSQPGTMVADLLLVSGGMETPLGRAVFRRAPGSEVPPEVPEWMAVPW